MSGAGVAPAQLHVVIAAVERDTGPGHAIVGRHNHFVEMQPRDIYLRPTSATGSSYVQQHRVWDADRFIAGAQSEATKANAEVKDGSGKARMPSPSSVH